MGRPYAEDITDTTQARTQLWDLIKDIKFAMFTTRHGNGHLHARPMTTQNRSLEADDSLWFFMALAAANVSYLDDQSIGADLGGGRANYYERVTPLPGRAFNRYRLAYIPFVESVTSPDWWRSPIPGQGPDFFPMHLAQAHRQLPDGSVIPVWLIGAIPIWWATLLLGSAAALYKR